MKVNDLNRIALKKNKRVGRGISAGQGKTAGRGTKGQRSRTGKKIKASFEGGQTPLIKRIPKLRGFTSKAIRPDVVYTSDLNHFSGVVTNKELFEAGLITSSHAVVKVIRNGEKLSSKIVLKTQKISEEAQKEIEKAGGSFEKVMKTPYETSVRKSPRTKK